MATGVQERDVARLEREVRQLEHLADENGRLWDEARARGDRLYMAMLGILQICSQSNHLEFHQLRKVLVQVERIAGVEIHRG